MQFLVNAEMGYQVGKQCLQVLLSGTWRPKTQGADGTGEKRKCEYNRNDKKKWGKSEKKERNREAKVQPWLPGPGWGGFGVSEKEP